MWGKLTPAKDNAIVYPTWYSGKHTDNDWLIGPGKGLDPSKYFIIVPNMLGNGLSSSPSNTPPPSNAAHFPQVLLTCDVSQWHYHVPWPELNAVTDLSIAAFEQALNLPFVDAQLACQV